MTEQQGEAKVRMTGGAIDRRTVLKLGAVAGTAAFLAAGAVTLFSSAAGLATDALWFQPLIRTAMAVMLLIVASQNIAGGVRAIRSDAQRRAG